jgi:hypothetical protein
MRRIGERAALAGLMMFVALISDPRGCGVARTRGGIAS